METKSHHVLIGSFVILFMASLFIFLVWASKFEGGREYSEYDIYFEESVLGLDKSSSVLFNGIPVGDVLEIAIDTENTQLVYVGVKIRTDVPILEGTTATLAMQGITGVLSVQVMGGPPGGQPLVAKPGEARPVIPSTPSPIAEFFVSAPDLIHKAAETLTRINRILGDENIQNISQSISNVETLTEGLAGEVETLRGGMVALKDTLNSAQSIFENELQPAAKEFRLLARQANQLVARVDQLVADNQENVTAFTGNSLPEINLLLLDIRDLTQTLNSLIGRLEENPSEIIFPRKDPEYEVE